MSVEPEKLKNYFFMSYLFSFITTFIVITCVILFGNFYFELMSPNEDIYNNCCRIKLMVCWYIFAENAYYFFMGCLKGYGYLRNTTIATIVMFFVISPLFIYILAFRCQIGVKGIWESTSFSMTLGDILFIYWVFSFDLIKIKELANKRIKADDQNIIEEKKDEKDLLFRNKNEIEDLLHKESLKNKRNNIEMDNLDNELL